MAKFIKTARGGLLNIEHIVYARENKDGKYYAYTLEQDMEGYEIGAENYRKLKNMAI